MFLLGFITGIMIGTIIMLLSQCCWILARQAGKDNKMRN